MVLCGKRVTIVSLVKDVCSSNCSKILKGAKDWQRQGREGYLGTVIKGDRRYSPLNERSKTDIKR